MFAGTCCGPTSAPKTKLGMGKRTGLVLYVKSDFGRAAGRKKPHTPELEILHTDRTCLSSSNLIGSSLLSSLCAPETLSGLSCLVIAVRVFLLFSLGSWFPGSTVWVMVPSV